jgi:hypothetical protein
MDGMKRRRPATPTADKANASRDVDPDQQNALGNAFMQDLVATGASSSGKTEEGALAPGPYLGDRKKNPPMDTYEHNKHLFVPHIFTEYRTNDDLWKPLDDFVKAEIKNKNANIDAGSVRIRDPKHFDALWKMLETFDPSAIKQHQATLDQYPRTGKVRVASELFAIYWQRAYPKSRSAAIAEFDKTNYRKDHEWCAVKFAFVPSNTAYWAKK